MRSYVALIAKVFSVKSMGIYACCYLLANIICMLSFMRLSHSYAGTDPKIQPYLNKYIQMAKEHHIDLKRNVTIGFKNFSEPLVIGQCNRGLGFREIDIASVFWNKASENSKTILILHEASHCYCDRIHDYAPDKKYDKELNSKDGAYPDGCKLSIMSPYIISDICFLSHYQEYLNELFQRCEPYK